MEISEYFISILTVNENYAHTIYLLVYTINGSHKDLNQVSRQATILDLSFVHQKLQLTHS
jgi:hypothetical protein